MTWPFEHNYLTVHGTTFTPETFTFGLRFAGSVRPTQAMIDACATPTQTFWNTAAVGMSSLYSLTSIKLARVLPSGLYPEDFEPVIHDFTPDAGPATSGAQHPTQVSLAVTTRTAVSRGRGHAGRFYLPGPRVDLDSSGKLTTTTAQAIATAAALWISTLNDVTDLGVATVMSRLGSGASSAAEPGSRLRPG